MAAKTKPPCTLKLSGELTVRTVADTHQRLLSAYAKSAAILIDTSAVDEADLSLVQLIEAARRSALVDGKRLALSPPPSAALHAVLKRGGFLSTSEDSSFWKGE